MIEFEPFPKLARLSRGCVITEKIDGTNAQVFITHEEPEDKSRCITYLTEVGPCYIFAGSRTRIITPGKDTDNFGFAAWVWNNADELVKLGPGRHFGEWYGRGIQRGYGLTERRFALFNTHRWYQAPDLPSCCEVVPVLYTGSEFDTTSVDIYLHSLSCFGSSAVPGFMDPEGVVVFHEASRTAFKKTFDDRHKEAA